MKKLISVLSLLLVSTQVNLAIADKWKPVEGAMLTQWGEKVTPKNAWTEYPRPQLQRDKWVNLNGLWNFTTLPKDSEQPQTWTQQILVPFVMEAPLSGIGQRLKPDRAMWYQRSFIHKAAANKNTLLHFEGVDYYSTVWLNGKKVGEHKGGNLPFSFDVSQYLQAGKNDLVVKVIDDTDKPGTYQLRGKQKINNGGIWYSPSSGIWQTVWLEQVAKSYIQDVKILGNMEGQLDISAQLAGAQLDNARLKVSVLDKGKVIARFTGNDSKASINVDNVKLWAPNSPKLYDLKIELLDQTNKTIDTVKSYVGFRTVGKRLDEKGNWLFTLNGENIFHYGPLDQGWWPDGYLNPPSDEAIVFEMDFLKAAGFNMIRKHKKVESRRYYYHADKIGFLVWQDHVSGGSGGSEWPKWKRLHALSKDYVPEPEKKRLWQNDSDPLDAVWPDWAHQQFMSELKVMMDTLHNHPSVVVWTTFNEAWGQHRTLEVATWASKYDPSRLINVASGGNFLPVGDIADQHQYPDPFFPFDVALYNDYVKVVGEYGGHGWSVDGHVWQGNNDKEKFVYGVLPKSLEEYIGRYKKSTEILGQLKTQGVSAGVYTQTTDVEVEINGLMTYDRKVIKIPAKMLYEMHKENGLTK